MIILLFGPDDYRRSFQKRDIKKRYTEKHGASSAISVDMESDGARSLAEEFLSSRSLFNTKKLAVIDHCFSITDKPFRQLLQSYVSHPDTTILLDCPAAIPKPFSFLSDPSVLHHDFPYLEGAPWLSYVRRLGRMLGVSLTDSATRFLADVFARDTWGLSSELESLCLLHPGASIDLPDLGHLAPASDDFFNTIFLLQSDRLEVRLRSLERLLAHSHEPAKIFAVFASVAKKQTARCGQFDVLIKQGKLDYEEALVDLAIR